MFFWYSNRRGRWNPIKSADQPYKISAEEKKFLWPYTDFGLGYALDMHERQMTLDELVLRYPPPSDGGDRIPAERDPNPAPSGSGVEGPKSEAPSMADGYPASEQVQLTQLGLEEQCKMLANYCRQLEAETRDLRNKLLLTEAENETIRVELSHLRMNQAMEVGS